MLGLAAVGSPAAAQAGVQQDWRYCGKCAGMFWNGAPDKGRCAGGGGHVAQGFQFLPHYDAGKGGAGGPYQYDWRFCSKCKVMFYDGSPNKGRCPAGKGHAAEGFMFGLNTGKPAGIAQSDWRFCQKCNDLFWNIGHGACAAGGAHVAQGFTFAMAFLSGKQVDPSKIIVDAVSQGIPAALQLAQPFLLAEMGQPNLLGKGYSLHKMNLRFAQADVRYHAPNFEVTLNDNYLYTQVTQPSVLGSYADPAFEIHFDVKLRGEVEKLPNGKLHVLNVVADVPHILVKPRDVTGGIVTTVVRFYQMTGPGGRRIQNAVDKYLRLDLTSRINTYLDTFS
ncbi:MAG TPA: hypothetical protein VG407_11995 [Caulobacteraceae bacterium]|nr:hypothetical protein [Caulobacteraceae bacterium]